MTLSAGHSLLASTVLAILPLFGLIGFGALARKSGLLESIDSDSLSKFAVQIAYPSLIFVTLATQRFIPQYFLLPTIVWVVQIIAISCIFGFMTVRRMPRPNIGSAILGTFGNTAFLGYPITTALFPAQLPAAVLIDQFATTPMLYPGAILLGPIFGEASQLHKVSMRTELTILARSPIVFGLVAGIAAHLLLAAAPAAGSFELTKLAFSVLSLIAAATVPVVMIAIGMRLRVDTIKRYSGSIATIGVVKLIAMPLISFLIGRYVYHLSAATLSVVVLQCGMPISAAATVFAGRYGMNSELAYSAFAATTLASAVTLPLVVTCFR